MQLSLPLHVPFTFSIEAILCMCILVQDHLLLAAPCKWVHHLCTDLKEESKCSETDGETSMSHGSLYESLHRQFNCSHGFKKCRKIFWFEVKHQFCTWRQIVKVNYLFIRHRERKRETEIRIAKMSFLSFLVAASEADGACWRTTGTGFMTSLMMSWKVN